MQVFDTAIPEVKLIRPARRTDERGYFSEVYSRRAWAEAGLAFDFVQDNQSLSLCRGVIRGLHFQVPPFAQTKLVRVVHGRILDVAVDVRYGSPSFGRFVAAVLSSDRSDQLLVPKGFAHGFCTLEPSTEVAYKVDSFYEPGHDRGLLWNDPDLGIAWPVRPQDMILSDRDRRHPTLGELPHYFLYAEHDGWHVPNPPWNQCSAEGTATRPPAPRP